MQKLINLINTTEEAFWKTLENKLNEIGFEIYDVGDLEPDTLVMPSSATKGHIIAYQEIIAKSKDGKATMTLIRKSENFFGQTSDTVKVKEVIPC